MCNRFVDKFGTDLLKSKWQQKLSNFDIIGSYCLTEANSGSDSVKMETFAEDHGDHYIVNG